MGKLFNTIKPLFLICFLLCTHFVLNAQKREPLTIKQLESTKKGSVILDYINTYNNERKKTKTEVSLKDDNESTGLMKIAYSGLDKAFEQAIKLYNQVRLHLSLDFKTPNMVYKLSA